jgi:hypothetical protein
MEEEMKSMKEDGYTEEDPKRSASGGESSQQQEERPISVETHYEIFKAIESHLKDYLGGLDHSYFLVGLRVAYDRDQSASEPGVLPFSVEFGYMAPADEISKCHVDEPVESGEAVEEELRRRSQRAAIPFDQLREFYAMTKAELESATGEPIRVGIAIVLTGSPVQSYVAQCDCASRIMRYCCYDPAALSSFCKGCSSQCDM